MGRPTLTDAEIERQIEEARERTRKADRTEPRAESACYNQETGRVKIQLTNGCMFAFPVELGQGLQGATDEELAEVEVMPGGKALHWETINAGFLVAPLLRGIFGSKAWMRELGRRGGRSTSEAKARAARENGKKGGRPPKRAGRKKEDEAA